MVTKTSVIARKPAPRSARASEAEISFESPRHFADWLRKNHAALSGVIVVLGKKGAAGKSVTYQEALDVALAWGWIDGVKRSRDAECWLQRFSPRTEKSPWSKINREKATALIAAGKMHEAGLRQVERAKKDGRWEAAYDSARTSSVPKDLEAALAANPRARKFFESIDGANRYAILYRVQTAKKPETRAERITKFVGMLAKHETLHPPREKKSKAPAKGR
jgi:uncharacterized protein YdeI (YjbR/CyaY-like superfamily)